MSSTDADLVRASLHEPERFEAVFDQHHRVIWRYLARMAGREWADDLAGDVFVVAFARRGTYDPARGTVRSWLYGIAADRLRSRLRTETRARQAFARAGQELVEAVDEVEQVEARLDHQARLRAVVAALVQLPARDREVIVLFAWERLTYEEIAAVTGVAEGTVRSRLSRARARLRELVGPSGQFSDEANV